MWYWRRQGLLRDAEIQRNGNRERNQERRREHSGRDLTARQLLYVYTTDSIFSACLLSICQAHPSLHSLLFLSLRI
jgi:hypothetical protein